MIYSKSMTYRAIFSIFSAFSLSVDSLKDGAYAVENPNAPPRPKRGSASSSHAPTAPMSLQPPVALTAKRRALN